ncbi:MAG: 2,3-bisphosphoglycerate-independent phosphoglycerate mutase [Acidobacteria bacterium]|nr:MAG: 2,3-bisphosphoglycerate-independent phosphoglycerate mutase [Acidobacteriota bacterium]
MPQRKGPLALIIIDGWGQSPAREGNAIAMASKPFYDELCEKYPHTLLTAHGTRVGLPDGVMGNSEVGHLNLGSGRVIRMDVSVIDHEIETGEFFRNEVLAKAMDGAKSRGKQLHLMGLFSDGQVHSSQSHLFALLRIAKQRGVERVFVHCFLDGRDTPPSSAADYVAALQEKIAEIGCGQIATVVGRYYAMDRDRRWERTQRAYDLLVNAVGKRAKDAIEAIQESYQRGVTDEFVEPIVIENEGGAPVATIQEGDAVIFFNFRPDRARQITRALAIAGFDESPIPNRPTIDFVCFSVYDVTFPLAVAFPPRKHQNILITYFFNGGTEKEFRCEQRLLVPSPKIATYDLEPEMSAFKITNNVLRFIDEGQTDVFIINFANPDMVGHTGKLDKTIEACQYVDTCLGWITKAVRAARGITLITADHGNAEQMIDPKTGQPHTAHTTNPVPFHLIDADSRGVKLREGGALEDVAPTMIGLLGIDKPEEMTGRDLRKV